MGDYSVGPDEKGWKIVFGLMFIGLITVICGVGYSIYWVFSHLEWVW